MHAGASRLQCSCSLRTPRRLWSPPPPPPHAPPAPQIQKEAQALLSFHPFKAQVVYGALAAGLGEGGGERRGAGEGAAWAPSRVAWPAAGQLKLWNASRCLR